MKISREEIDAAYEIFLQYNDGETEFSLSKDAIHEIVEAAYRVRKARKKAKRMSASGHIVILQSGNLLLPNGEQVVPTPDGNFWFKYESSHP